MFSSDKNIETISRLISEIKRYIELRGKSLQIDFVCKLAVIASAMVLGLILFLLGGLAILFISNTAVATLTTVTGSAIAANAIVVLVYLLLGTLIYAKRRTWIQAPIANFLANLFLGEDKTDGEDSAGTKQQNP